MQFFNLLRCLIYRRNKRYRVHMKGNVLAPAIFAVNRDYHIMLYTDKPCLMWIKVGEQVYYDENNGILRSDTEVHRVIVPQFELDSEKSYVVCLKYIIDRKPYFPETEPVVEIKYDFRPVTDAKGARAYHIADAHNWLEGPLAAAQVFGNIDFLILNGDIPQHCGSADKFLTVYELTSELTKGEIPTVFARGNHDMRGFYAEKFGDYTPSNYGKTYYTFRLGSVWGMILDCGEDKVDENPEYGGTICCHNFRIKETAFIEDIIAKSAEEYLAEGICHRIVICHCPFTFRLKPPFDIEEEVYTEWTRLMREHIHPDVIINGHTHAHRIIRQGDERDHRNQSCPVVIGTTKKAQEYYVGAGLVFDENGIEVHFTDSNHKLLAVERL